MSKVIGKLRITVVEEWEVTEEDLADYDGATTLEEAAQVQQKEFDEGNISVFDMLADPQVVKFEVVK